MKHNKIIFLDVDGVINTVKHHFSKFDEECLERIRRIITETGAKVVVSSSWREGDLERTKKHFPPWLQEHIIGETIRGYKETIKGSSLPIERGNEIEHWIDRNLVYPWHANPEMDAQYRVNNPDGSFKIMNSNKLNVDFTYVILDDDDQNMLYEQRHNFVCTDSYKGISDEHTEEAIRILNKI
jgi:hypothetical protein